MTSLRSDPPAASAPPHPAMFTCSLHERRTPQGGPAQPPQEGGEVR